MKGGSCKAWPFTHSRRRPSGRRPSYTGYDRSTAAAGPHQQEALLPFAVSAPRISFLVATPQMSRQAQMGFTQPSGDQLPQARPVSFRLSLPSIRVPESSQLRATPRKPTALCRRRHRHRLRRPRLPLSTCSKRCSRPCRTCCARPTCSMMTAGTSRPACCRQMCCQAQHARLPAAAARRRSARRRAVDAAPCSPPLRSRCQAQQRR